MIKQQTSTMEVASPLWDGAPQPLVSTPPSPTCDVCVVIPVRDECDTLMATLTALANQIDLHGRPLDPERYEIIVLANNCRDDSATVARRFAALHHQIILHVVELDLPRDRAHVGQARRLLMDEACRRLIELGKARGVIATTDGDTLVSPTWVAGIRDEIYRGADAVGGRILVDPVELQLLSDAGRKCHLRDVGYRSLVAELESLLDPNIHDPWPRHFQHFGASLAATAEAYLRAGRLPVKPWFEDVAFYDALMRVDARFRHSPAVRVRTSGRSTGRTEFGFAVQLSQWESMSARTQPMCVRSAQAVEAWIMARRNLRQVWDMQRHAAALGRETLEILAGELQVDPGWIGDALRESASFGVLVERLQLESERRRERWPLVDIHIAIWDLRCRLDALRNGSPLAGLLKKIEPVETGALSAQVS